MTSQTWSLEKGRDPKDIDLVLNVTPCRGVGVMNDLAFDLALAIRRAWPTRLQFIVTETQEIRWRTEFGSHAVIRVPRWAERGLGRLIWERWFMARSIRDLGADAVFHLGLTPLGRLEVPYFAFLSNSAPFEGAILRENVRERWRLRMLLRLARRTAKSAAGILAISETAANSFRDSTGAQGPIAAVLCDINIQALIEFNGPSEFAPPKPFILSVGHLHRYKALEDLLVGYARACEYSPQFPPLVHVGAWSDRRYFKELQHLISGLGIQDRVRFTGRIPRPHLGYLYRTADLVAYMSRTEALGTTVPECIKLGVPLALPRCTAFPEAAGPAALYFDPDNPNEVAHVLYDALYDHDVRKRLFDGAIEQSKKYSWENTLTGLESLLTYGMTEAG